MVFCYKDIDVLMKGAAELLNKQDLCTREKPARAAFLKMSKTKGRPKYINIKKMPALILKVFAT